MLKRSDRGQRNLNKKLQKVPRNLVQQKLPLTVEMSPIIDMNGLVTSELSPVRVLTSTVDSNAFFSGFLLQNSPNVVPF